MAPICALLRFAAAAASAFADAADIDMRDARVIAAYTAIPTSFHAHAATLTLIRFRCLLIHAAACYAAAAAMPPCRYADATR